MKATISSMVFGTLFGLGLGLSGMTDPLKVLGFLDLTGTWDPSLLGVMGAAIPIFALANTWALRRQHPILDGIFHLPTRKEIDRKLVLGSVIFGIGWGLSGICPGPGFAVLSTGSLGAVVFVLTFFVGAGAAGRLERKL